MEGAFRIGGFYLDDGAGNGAVAHGGHAFVLLDNAYQRASVRPFGRKAQLAVLQGKVANLTIGHRSEKTEFISLGGGDAKTLDGMALSVEDAFEGVAPPFGRSELIGPLVFADGVPVGYAGKVQVVFQHIPAIEVFPDSIQVFYRTHRLGSNPLGIKGQGLLHLHGIRGGNKKAGIVAKTPFLIRQAVFGSVPAAEAVTFPCGIRLGLGREHTAGIDGDGSDDLVCRIIQVKGYRILGKGSRACQERGCQSGDNLFVHYFSSCPTYLAFATLDSKTIVQVSPS